MVVKIAQKVDDKVIDYVETEKFQGQRNQVIAAHFNTVMVGN